MSHWDSIIQNLCLSNRYIRVLLMSGKGTDGSEFVSLRGSMSLQIDVWCSLAWVITENRLRKLNDRRETQGQPGDRGATRKGSVGGLHLGWKMSQARKNEGGWCKAEVHCWGACSFGGRELGLGTKSSTQEEERYAVNTIWKCLCVQSQHLGNRGKTIRNSRHIILSQNMNRSLVNQFFYRCILNSQWICDF